MKILILAQNETHAKNFAALAGTLRAAGHTLIGVCLDGVTHQETRSFLAGVCDLLELPLKLERPFYSLPLLRKLHVLLFLRSLSVPELAGVDAVLIGNDGALQRSLLKKCGRDGLKKYLVVDGNLTYSRDLVWRIKIQARRFLLTLGGILGVSEFMPSVVGHSGVDLIFVMNESAKQALIRQGVDSAKVIVCLLPRHKDIFNLRQTRRDIESIPEENIRYLYATTAYEWHGLMDFAARQKKEILSLLEHFRTGSAGTLRIRIHPRDSFKSSEWLANAVCEISSPEVSLSEDLTWADVVLVSRSSVAFEAELAARPCCVSTEFFPEPEVDDYFGEATHVLLLDSFCDLGSQGSLERIREKAHPSRSKLMQFDLEKELPILLEAN